MNQEGRIPGSKFSMQSYLPTTEIETISDRRDTDYLRRQRSRLKLQALVYDILPLEEGAGKRCLECDPDYVWPHRYRLSLTIETHIMSDHRYSDWKQIQTISYHRDTDCRWPQRYILSLTTEIQTDTDYRDTDCQAKNVKLSSDHRDTDCLWPQRYRLSS